LYEDVVAAIDWLGAAFGFRERMRIPGPAGDVAHAEMVLADGLIMMGCPGPEYKSPKRMGQVTQHLYVYVDDVNAHFERARKAGAKIIEEPKDQFYGDRRYGAEDPEGHCWYFAEHVRDISAEELKAAAQQQ
jgi:uncharacterized glyoxalase superfamily protein PhnB